MAKIREKNDRQKNAEPLTFLSKYGRTKVVSNHLTRGKNVVHCDHDLRCSGAVPDAEVSALLGHQLPVSEAFQRRRDVHGGDQRRRGRRAEKGQSQVALPGEQKLASGGHQTGRVRCRGVEKNAQERRGLSPGATGLDAARLSVALPAGSRQL